ncbi:MAG: heparinase II/III family protein, partial [Gemmatimonadota bacterium]|nr:heparinase II/III family protein [Gemmatimonadota bacterium]
YFDKMFRVLPADGTSGEDISYGLYGLDFNLKYADLARDLLDRDYFGSEWFRNSPDYILHSMVPSPTEEEQAITFGDAPRHLNWHGPEHSLFLLASEYGNTTAQWLARYFINLRPEGLSSATFWAILWYDPSIGEADPAEFVTFKHFTDMGQVMMRSSWTDPTAMLVGLKCGPFMGKAQSAEAQFDWGTNHSHPDEGSFQIFSHGQYLAVDPLYTHFKLTANHNTMLFKGQGQLGERLVWNVVEEQVRFKHYPEIIKAGSTPASDYVVADVARAYHPALGVGKYLRHYLFIKPDILAVADEITLDDSGVLYQYPCGEFTVTGGFEHGYEGYAVGTGGEASVVFKGAPGTYRLSVIFLDNYPGEGRYSFTVDDSTVFKWTATKEKTDNYCIVSPEVELKTGSRVAVCCAQREHGYRVIKMTVFSRHAPAVRRVAQWLVHFDPQAKVERRGSLVTSTLAPAALDLYSLAPAGSSMKVEDFRVKKASMEPFRSRGTKRLVISPPFSDSSTTILTLMHTRAAQGPVLENVKATAFDSSRRTRLSWLKDGKPVSVVWDLGKMEYRFE